MKVLSVTLAAASAAVLVLIGAAPAIAAGNSIDPGDSLYAVNCDSNYPDWQLLSVESTTAASTTIGTGETPGEGFFACGYQPAYDASTGKSYYIQTHYSDGNQYFLAELNTSTGVSTEVGQFIYTENEEQLFLDIESMAIGTDGAAFVLAQGFLYSVDLSSGELTQIASSLEDVYAFAVDPTSGVFYGIDDYNELFTVNTTTGHYDHVGTVEVSAGTIDSLQIDGGGTFWVQANEESESGAGLWSFTLAAGTPVYSGPFIDGPFYTRAILIIPGDAPPPKPQLAATGVDAGVGAGAATLLALAGIALVVMRRRRVA